MTDEAPPGDHPGPARPGAGPAAPGGTGPAVNGWRYWRLDPVTGLLRSLTMRAVSWQPGRPVRAWCRTGHRAPAAGCACGVYGAPHLASLHEHGLCLPQGGLVVGEVALWGETVRDAGGYRAEYGYPARLSVVEETVPDGAVEMSLGRLARYGVPVETTSLEQAVGGVSGAIMAFQAMSGGAGCTY